MHSDLDNAPAENTPLEAEPKKSSRRILRHELREAFDALERSAGRLFISGLSAGLDLGFSLFLMAIVISMAGDAAPQPWLKLLTAAMYSFGFIIVILGRSELFTEQTTLAVLPLLSGRTTPWKVARLWGLVYTSNLLGIAAAAFFITQIGPELGVIDKRVFGEIAHRVVDHPGWLILCSAGLAGWLMGLLSWLVAAGRDTISQIAIVWMITTAIGLGHLHHVVLGTAEVLGGVFSNSGVTWHDFARFLLWTTLGNAIGGPVFVALLRYGQVQLSRQEEEEAQSQAEADQPE